MLVCRPPPPPPPLPPPSSVRSLCECIVDLMAFSLLPLTPKLRTVLGRQGGKSRGKALLAIARQLSGEGVE